MDQKRTSDTDNQGCMHLMMLLLKQRQDMVIVINIFIEYEDQTKVLDINSKSTHTLQRFIYLGIY